jgi:hypothetical protein
VAPDARDRVHIDCETIERPVSCPARWRRGCKVTGILSTAGRRRSVLGRGTLSAAAGVTRSLRVPLSSRARTIVRRGQRVDVRLGVLYRAGKRRRGPVSIRFSLHATLPAPG